jgi:hypothetical protein
VRYAKRARKFFGGTGGALQEYVYVFLAIARELSAKPRFTKEKWKALDIGRLRFRVLCAVSKEQFSARERRKLSRSFQEDVNLGWVVCAQYPRMELDLMEGRGTEDGRQKLI